MWYENSEYFQWIGGRPEGVTSSYYVGAGNNWSPNIVDVHNGLLTLPLTPPQAQRERR